MEHEEAGDMRAGLSDEAVPTNQENAVGQKPTGPSGHVKGKSKMKTHFTVLPKKSRSAKPTFDKTKIRNMPFTTRSGKERLRPWPVFWTGEGGMMSPPAVPPLCKKKKKTRSSPIVAQIPEESPSGSTVQVEPDLSHTVLEEEVHTSICLPSASGEMSIRSPHADRASAEDTCEEMDQDVDSRIEKGDDAAGEEAVDDDDDVVVVKATVEPVAEQGEKLKIVMPGEKTKKTTSYVWNYFYPDPKNICLAVCTVCNATVSRGKDLQHLGTSSLLRHLQRVHHKFTAKESVSKKVPGCPPSPRRSLPSVACRGPESSPTTPSSTASTVLLNLETSPASNVLSRTDSLLSLGSSEASSSATPAASAAAAAGVKRGPRKAIVYDHPGCKQLTMKQAFARGQKYESTHPVAQRITDAITTMLVLDVRPVSSINSVGFTQLLEVLCPRYHIPSRFHFARYAIPGLYTYIKKSLVGVLKNSAVTSVHLTTDMWTSGSGQTKDYMAVTAHWVDVVPSSAAATSAATSHVLLPRQATLSICGFTKRHTAENLLQKLRQVIARWLTPLGLSSGFVVADNATNIVRALQVGKFKHVPCFAHTINLVVQHFLKNERAVQEMLFVVRKIVGHFRHSASACRRLQQLQENLNLPMHQLKQEVVTRWNSTLYMLQRMEEQQQAIQKYTSTYDIGKGTGMYLTQAHWRLISVLCKLLQPFEVATREISSDTATLSQVIPLIRLLQKHLEKMKEEFKHTDYARYVGLVDQALNALSQDQRVVHLLKSEHYVLATILDPRFKSYALSLLPAGTNLQWCKELLLRNLSSESELCRHRSPTSLSQSVFAKRKTNFPTKKPTKHLSANVFDIWSGLKEMPTATDLLNDTGYQAICVEKMVEDYMSTSIKIDMLDGPLNFWLEKKAMWGPLHKLALFYLSCPPSSVYSERVFSAAGHLISDRRRRLLPQNVEKMMFIKMNFQFHQQDLLQPQLRPENSQGPGDSSEDEFILCDEEDEEDENEGEESDDEDDLEEL